jgi:CRP/FNR family transcriptional regulator, cyclic AMP receptor protein
MRVRRYIGDLADDRQLEPSRSAPLLDLDPELGDLLQPASANDARAELLVKVARLAKGPTLHGLDGTSRSRGHLGLLMIDGLVGRELLTEDMAGLELLGPGDLLRPWQSPSDERLLAADVRWDVLTPTRVAVLDRQAAVRLARYPEVYAVLIERLTDRAQRLAVTQTICQLNRVDQRVLAMLWHLAGRWGRVTADGTLLPLAISHRMLSQLVGARRPTVSTACGELTRQGELVRERDGTWLLTGEPVGAPLPASARYIPPRRQLIAT